MKANPRLNIALGKTLKWEPEHTEYVTNALSEVGNTLDVGQMSKDIGLTVRTIRDKVSAICRKNGWTLQFGFYSATVAHRVESQDRVRKSPSKSVRRELRPAVYSEESLSDRNYATKRDYTRYVFKLHFKDNSEWSTIAYITIAGLNMEDAKIRLASMLASDLHIDILDAMTADEYADKKAMANMAGV